MENQANLGGVFTMPRTSLTLNRIGYGAMQLPGPQVWGPPKDRYAALALLKEAIALGINHVDSANYYGPNVSNELIREALYPYPDNLVIVTKLGYSRGPDRSWQPALSAADLERAVHSNLTVLRLDAIDIVNLRLGGDGGPREGSIKAPLEVPVGLTKKGLIRHIGLSNVTPRQFAEAESITEIVCVQNYYNVAHREDDDFIDILAGKGVAYIPFFPLGGFTPFQSTVLDEAARVLKATPMQVSLAWLLHRAPNILLIPGTSSVKHLRENLGAATVELPREVRMKIDTIAVVHRPH
jgi:pyridoxine 4-dehydrogenase